MTAGLEYVVMNYGETSMISFVNGKMETSRHFRNSIRKR